jgi:hypothetical protein
MTARALTPAQTTIGQTLPIAIPWRIEDVPHALQLFAANTIGRIIRDHLLLPNAEQKFSPEVFQDSLRVLDPDAPDPIHYPRKKEVLQLFRKEEQIVAFQCGDRQFHAKVWIFSTNFPSATETHTCVRIGGADEPLALTPIRLMPYLSSFFEQADGKRNLRFIQISPFDITEQQGDNVEPWKPTLFKDIGKTLFSLLDALKDKGYPIDSMICHSMGSALLEGIEDRDPASIPKTLILDRALPSVWKVGRQLLNPITFYILIFLAYCSGWTGNPEGSITAFFNKMRNQSQPVHSLTDRQVIMIEAGNDFYFSGKGAFSPSFAQTLRDIGVKAFQHPFSTNPLRLHTRAHHACPIHYLYNTSAEMISQGGFMVRSNQDVASAIVQNIFLKRHLTT